jgi:hypothetical protein
VRTVVAGAVFRSASAGNGVMSITFWQKRLVSEITIRAGVASRYRPSGASWLPDTTGPHEAQLAMALL